MDDSIARLVDRARRHEHEAFAELLTFSLPMARALCSRLLPDGGDVDDVLQEACLQAWLGLDGLQRPERFRQWLTGIALNLARMRARAWRPRLPLESSLGDAIDSVEAVIEAEELRRDVNEAVGGLPDSARSTVAAFYFDGRSLPEISADTGTPVGTLKARLSRARQTLRSALVARPSAPAEIPDMIEVIVQAVLTQEPPTDPARPVRVLVLAEKAGARVLPIWIGRVEGDFLALQLSGQAPPRPLTLNLLAQILSITGMTLEQVAINRLHDEVFYATLALTVGGQPQSVDARPSDAVNLAMLKGVPIFVAAEILESQGMASDALGSHLTAQAPPEPMTWVPAVPPEWQKAK
ncbi:MAG: bifunctional nuclease family protein [Anaerolineales bacterium]|nr:bifunctional nuclease family protein [Anaerolineales bacterium]